MSIAKDKEKIPEPEQDPEAGAKTDVEESHELVEPEQEEETAEDAVVDEVDDIESLSPGELQKRLEEALDRVGQFRDMALRAEAEMQNVRRRSERDVEHAHKFGLERFLQNLLPIVDSLEKAIEAAEQAGKSSAIEEPIIEGVRICLKMLLDLLTKEHVEVIDPEGEPFDPRLHQAMTVIESPDMEPNSVVKVVQKGYLLNGRLIRPAMVIVSKNGS